MARLPARRAAAARCEPTSRAKYVAFETLHDPAQMPGQRRSVLDWPYREGLRIDEAMHPLALLATGMYGRDLPNQNGAPLRLVVPWKYGFKSIKSIVRISLVEKQPPTTWNQQAPNEYGFYSNVNPAVTIRAGARPRSAASASCGGARRCSSTATPSRWRGSTPGWTCRSSSECGAPGRVPFTRR